MSEWRGRRRADPPRARGRTERVTFPSLAEQLPRDHEPLDLARAFADRQSFTSRKNFSAG